MKHYKTPRWPFSKLCSSLLCAYCSNKLPERGPKLSITQLRTWAHRRSAYAQLSPLYLSLYTLHHSRDKIYQALYHFSALQATESWVGPGNEATTCWVFANPVTYRLEYNKTQIMKDNLSPPLIPSHPSL